MIGAAIAVGVAAGFLEFAVQEAQVRGLHLVDWSTLMISRHVAWMLPATGAAVVVSLVLVLVTPALAWSAWRRQNRWVPSRPTTLAWDWTGWVLGTLLLLGPLLAIRGFHPAAPVAVAVGVGFRIRRGLVRPVPGWSFAAYAAAGIAIGLLAGHGVWQGSAAVSASRSIGRGLPPAPKAPNLLWIVLDTLRADRMSVYGYDRATTPELEAWAREAITFELARSAAPWTLPSHVTMFTGLWPSEHGACIDRSYSGPSPTLAEHLRSRGYATAGVVANVRMCNTAYGVGRGFDFYRDYPCRQEVSLKAAVSNSALGSALTEIARRLCLPAPDPYPFYLRRPASEIASEGRQWLESARRGDADGTTGSDRPFFLFLNLMDVHGPYLPAPETSRRFWTGPAPTKKDARPEDGWLALQARNAAPPADRPRRQQELEAVGRRLGDLYDDCLRGLDADFGRFLRECRAGGFLANTWVVITADHGEHFGEHDQFGHGSSLYNELTHVPLILIPPLGGGGPAADPYAGLRGRRIGVPVSLRDLPRTMTGLLGSGTENPFPGRSLARHWQTDHPESPDPVLSQLEEPRLKGEDFRTHHVLRVDSLIDEDHVLIDFSNRPAEVYDLFGDPKQHRNLAGRAEDRSCQERLARTLQAIREQTRRPGATWTR